jgi:hypothetical protein
MLTKRLFYTFFDQLGVFASPLSPDATTINTSTGRGLLVSMSSRVPYWWPGEEATNTRDFLLFKGQRYNSGETLVMKEVMSTLENTLAMDGVPEEMRPSTEQVRNWFIRHRYKATM